MRHLFIIFVILNGLAQAQGKFSNDISATDLAKRVATYQMYVKNNIGKAAPALIYAAYDSLYAVALHIKNYTVAEESKINSYSFAVKRHDSTQRYKRYLDLVDFYNDQLFSNYPVTAKPGNPQRREMYFSINKSTPQVNDSVLITINAGALEGLYKGLTINATSVTNTSMPKRKGMLRLATGLVTQVYPNYALALVKRLYYKDSLDKIYPGDVVSCTVNNSFRSNLGFYEELLTSNIIFTDNYNWRPYGLRAATVFESNAEGIIDTIFLNNMHQFAKEHEWDTAAGKWFRKKIVSGLFKGKDLLYAFRHSGKAQIRLFLNYVKATPASYISRRYNFYDVYGGWLINGSEVPLDNLFSSLVENKDNNFFEELLSVYGDGIFSEKYYLSWKNHFIHDLENSKFPDGYVEVFDSLARRYKSPEMLAWSDYMRAKAAAYIENLPQAAIYLASAQSKFAALQLPDEEKLCRNLKIQMQTSHTPVVAPQNIHFLPFSIAMSNNGKYFITYGLDPFMNVWDARYMRQVESINSHRSGTNSVNFSYDDKYFITAGADGFIRVWETGTFLMCKEINAHKPVLYAQLDMYEDKLVATDIDSTLTVYNFRTGKADTSYRLHEGKILKTFFQPRYPTLITTAGEDSLVYISSITDGRHLVEINAGGKVVTLINSDDRDFTAAMTDNHKIMVWRTNGILYKQYVSKTIQLNYRSPAGKPSFDLNSKQNLLAFIKDTFKLSLAFIDSSTVLSYDFGFKESIAEVKFFPDGKNLLVATYLGRFYIIHLSELPGSRLIYPEEVGSSSEAIHGIAYSNDDEKIAYQSGNIIYQDLTTGKGGFVGKESGIILSANLYFENGDSALRYIPANDASVMVLNLITSDTVYYSGLLDHNFYYVEMSADKTKMLSIIKPGNHSIVNIYDTHTGKLIHELALDSSTHENVRQAFFLNGTNNIAVINDSFHSVSVYGLSSYVPEMIHRGYITGVGDFHGACYINATKSLVAAGDDGGVYFFNPETGKVAKVINMNNYDSAQKTSVVAADVSGRKIFIGMTDRFFIYDLKKDTVVAEVPINGEAPVCATFNHQGTQLAWGDFSGQLHIYETRDYKELIDIYTFTDRAPVMITPDNYYLADKAALSNIYFKYNQRLYPFEQFDLMYNRPDKVLERLGIADSATLKTYQAAWIKRVKRSNSKFEQITSHLNPPSAVITNRDDLAAIAIKSPVLPLYLEFSDRADTIKYYNIWINGIPLYGKDWKKIEGNHSKITILDSIELSPAKNLVQVACKTVHGISSFREKLEITNYTAIAYTPKTYLFCVSVSDYKNPAYRLKYAAKDGRDLVSAFRKKLGNEFVVDTLFNANATLSNIMKWRTKMASTRINDRVIVYVSGHGLLDANSEFYYATYDVDFKNPAGKGLLYDQLEALLDKIPAREKMLLMDACHSGEIDKEIDNPVNSKLTTPNADPNVVMLFAAKGVGGDDDKVKAASTGFELMQEQFADINEGNGTTVISASAGNSFAYESDTWQNGIFTWSILKGLGDMDADKNKDGHVTISELRNYVNSAVTYYTKGAQKPTQRQANLDTNWTIW